MTALLGDLVTVRRRLDLNALLGAPGLTNPSVLMQADGSEIHLVLKRNRYSRRAVWQSGDRDWSPLFSPEGEFRVDHVHARLTAELEPVAAVPLVIPPLSLGALGFDAADDIRLIAWNGVLHLLGSCMRVPAVRAGQRWAVGRLLTRMFVAPLAQGAASARVLPAFFHGSDMDKNWVTHEGSSGDLLACVDVNRSIWIALPSAAGTPVRMPGHDLVWNGGWSGSSSLVETGQGYLAVLHRAVQLNPSVYRHMFVLCDRHFRVLRRSVPFTFEGEPIEFCPGLTRNPARRELVVSYGLWDDQARLLTLPEDEALALCRHGVADPRELYAVS